jgi:polyphosphate kinase
MPGGLHASTYRDAPTARFVGNNEGAVCAEERPLKQKTPGSTSPWMSAEEQTMKKRNKSTTAGVAKIGRKEYERELRKLQVELCKLQVWVKHKGLRVILVFEGRDGAGKGGTIKAITERVSPRVFRVTALPAPSDREKSQLYMQRYLAHFPAAGEIVIFDRSWYNRAGVEYVMGFCSKEEHRRFLELCPVFEKSYIAEDGIILAKFWLEVSKKEQGRRFQARIDDPLRQWKLSPVDLPSRGRWYDYSRARDMMLDATDTAAAQWHIVPSDDKKRARLNCISHLLSIIPYQSVPKDKVKLPKVSHKGAYDDQATMKDRRFVPEKY